MDHHLSEIWSGELSLTVGNAISFVKQLLKLEQRLQSHEKSSSGLKSKLNDDEKRNHSAAH